MFKAVFVTQQNKFWDSSMYFDLVIITIIKIVKKIKKTHLKYFSKLFMVVKNYEKI
jgi:hypothetical protein